MPDYSEEELRFHVLSFLKDFKELMRQGNYYVREHIKNIQALIELGLTTRLRDEIIFSITIEDYCSGPVPDQLHPGVYWIFGKEVEEVEIYIKLKIVTYSHGEKAICISFHPSEHPLRYPFRR
jgi:hypothetical protein